MATPKRFPATRLTNTSGYATDELRDLITQATKGINMDGVVLSIRGTPHTLAGYAYQGIPHISPWFRKRPRPQYLITIRIGAPRRFPHSTARQVTRWVPMTDADYQAALTADPTFHMRCRYVESTRHPVTIPDARMEQQIVTTEGYGGKRSPIIVSNTWQEGFLTLVAHEARHIHQYRHRLPASEVDCERFAARALDRYRTEQAHVHVQVPVQAQEEI